MRAVPLGAWIVAIVLGSASTGRAVVPITSCDQKVLAGETGVLQNDVVCDFRCTEDRSIVCGFDDRDTCVGKGACSPENLVLRQGGVLDLNGHEVSAAYQNHAVLCLRGTPSGRCVVRGPGKLTGGNRGVISTGPDVLVDGVPIEAQYDAVATPGFAEIRRSTLDSDGVSGGTGVKLVGTHSLSGTIRSGADIDLVRVKFGHGRSSIETPGTVRGRDVVMAGIVAITARDARLRRARTRSSDIYNWGSGVEVTRRVRVVDSDLTFVISPEPPKLVRSTCEHSVVSGTRATWGICTSD